MKALLLAFLLAGIVPATVRAQANYRARTLDLRTLSIEKEQDVDSCLLLDNAVTWYENQDAQSMKDTAYDTGRYLVEHCPGYPSSFGDFGGTFGSASQTQTPDEKLALRQFLLSLLPAATAGGNFCSCVWDLAYTYGSPTDRELQNRVNLSVLKFLLGIQACAGNDDLYARTYMYDRRDQIRVWADTAKNDSMQYFDSTLFSMHDLGLDSVLKYAGMLGVNSGSNETIISNASASPNPVSEGTEISFTTNREAYVKIDLFNILGVKLGVTGFEDVLEAGNHEVPVSLSGLPSGTYYARIVTTYGEVQTVKLVKE